MGRLHHIKLCMHACTDIPTIYGTKREMLEQQLRPIQLQWSMNIISRIAYLNKEGNLGSSVNVARD